MPTRKPSKSSSKRSKKATGAKRVKSNEGDMLVLEPVYPRPVKMRWSRKGSGVKQVRVWGDSGTAMSDVDLSTVGRMPNPMPEDIVSLLKLAGEATWLTIPLAPYVYLLIKSWFEGRNSKKFKIKKGDVEVEFQGAWSEKKLQKEYERFRKLTKDLGEDEIQVIENGKVIQSGSAPTYKIVQADIERARQLRSKESPPKAVRKRKAKRK